MTQTISHRAVVCPACESEAIDDFIENFDDVCTECGFVISDGADTTSPDWMVTEERSERSNRKEWLEFSRVQNATEQQLSQAFAVLEDATDRLGLCIEVRQEAAELYCDGFRAKTTDGRDTDTFVAAAIRIASQSLQRPIPVGRLTESPDVHENQFRLSQSALQNDLELSLKTPTAVDYLPFLTQALGGVDDFRIQEIERALESIAGDTSLVGKDPVGIAAATIYFVEDGLTQANVAEAAGVSTETIRQRVVQIRELQRQ